MSSLTDLFSCLAGTVRYLGRSRHGFSVDARTGHIFYRPTPAFNFWPVQIFFWVGLNQHIAPDSIICTSVGFSHISKSSTYESVIIWIGSCGDQVGNRLDFIDGQYCHDRYEVFNVNRRAEKEQIIYCNPIDSINKARATKAQIHKSCVCIQNHGPGLNNAV